MSNSVAVAPALVKTAVTAISQVKQQPAPKDACLVVIHGSDLGRKYDLCRRTLLIGRSTRNAVQIDQESVSRVHCKLVNDGERVILQDLASTNGTYVNDASVREVALRDGDFIKVGRTILKFLSSGNIERNYHEEIYRLTTMDGLTQAHNRRYFLEMLEREISRSRRYQRELSLIMVDVDHFKLINDNYGHIAGDAVLRDLSALVRGNLRKEDVFGRYGGEEFVILLPEISSGQAELVAEKLRQLVAEATFSFEQTTIPVTISCGVSPLPTDENDPLAFLAAADEQLYAAKKSGRNCVRTVRTT